MSIKLTIDVKSLDAVKDAVLRRTLVSATNAVHTATQALEQDFKGLTRAAVPGDAWKGWKSRAYPALGQPARKPEGAVFPNGKVGSRTHRMMEYWTQPGVNRAKDGYWLAIPTKAAGANTRRRDLTPGEWERRTGIKLQFVYARSKKFALLVAEGVEALNKSGALRRNSAGRAAQGRAAKTVTIFVLIPAQRHANTVSLETSIRAAQANLERTFIRYMELGI